MSKLAVEDIAHVTHEANRAYCKSIGDDSQVPWDEAPEWQRASAIKGVEFTRDNPLSNPIDSHDSWMREKEAAGWKYGPVKDAEKKEHPCFVPYEQLPLEQRRKDALFQAVARALLAGLLLALVPTVAHAQVVTAATAVGLGAWVAAHLTLSLAMTVLLAVLPAALGLLGLHLTAQRRAQVAAATHAATTIVQSAVDDLPAGSIASFGKAADQVLIKADAYMQRNGWAPLSPAEQQTVRSHVGTTEIVKREGPITGAALTLT